jgi:hypothetical protein
MATAELNWDQRHRVLHLIDGIAWGDMDRSICALEATLGLALKVTVDDLAHWEEELEPRLNANGIQDEFSVPAEAVEAMSTEERLAYVARLIKTVGLVYGLYGGFSARAQELPVGADQSPAALLRGLNDISWLP